MSISPAADVLPANVLRFYLTFSRPMREGRRVLDHITLLDDEGREIPAPWRDLDLWNDDATRLSLFVHPGRIKEGVNLREEQGPVLEPGRRYTLVVAAALCDTGGTPLAAPFRHTFTTTAELRTRLDPAAWRRDVPPPGSLAPFTVTFDRPFDAALVHRCLILREAAGAPVAGTTTLSPDGRHWSFHPQAPWGPVAAALTCDGALEDICGNTLDRPFDLDLAAADVAVADEAVAASAEPPAAGKVEHRVAPGDDPQAAVDRAAPGDRVVLLPGLHERPLGRHQSLLFIDKPLDLELSAGATLRLAAGQTTLEEAPEITTDHSAKTIDDLEMGGTYDRSQGPLLLTITIDGAAADDRSADTFSWAVGVFGKPVAQGIPITGDWQTLAHGIALRFPNRCGHNKGAFWFVSYDGPASYGIRVGHGTQVEPIDGVRIGGRGTIDMNNGVNVQPSEMVRDISACVLLHGRVRTVLVEEVTLANTMRSVMVYGEHTGDFLPGGGVGAGESFDAEGIDILGTRTINPGSPGYPRGAAYLLGHPSHRGRLARVRCNFNVMESVTTSIEPNFNLAGYEVIGNLIASGGEAVHCWRRSTDGIVVDNVRVADVGGRRVVSNNAPSGWAKSERLAFGGNVNLAAESLDSFGTFEPLPAGHTILGGTTTGPEPALLGRRAGPDPALTLPHTGSGRVRGIVAARSADGCARAAFQITARVVSTPTGPQLDDLVVLPVERTHDALDIAVTATAAATPPLVRISAQGLDGIAIEWRCHLTTAP